ncbi:MAG: FeoA family protein [Bacillota bacterium]
MQTTLNRMQTNHIGEVVDVRGGRTFRSKLDAMGIHRGRSVYKMGGSVWGGPITVRLNGCLVAVGRGMAERILLEVEDS